VSLWLVAACSLGCARLPLHVAAGLLRPPSFSDQGLYTFPHQRTPQASEEMYRVGDQTGADFTIQRLYVVKAADPAELVLIADPACPMASSFADTGVSLRGLHVAVTGSPDGDGSATNPFDQLSSAAAVARPGDRIVIHQGSYPGSSFVSDLQGTEINPIWISGAPSEPPPVLGSSSVGEAIHLSDPAWVVIQDLVVEGPTGNGINIDDGGDYSTPAHHVVVRRVTIRNIGTGGNQDCLKLSGLDEFLVLDSDFQWCGGGGSGIDMVGCHQGLIQHNQFRDMGSNAVQAKGGSSQLMIRGNLMVNAGERAMNLGGSTGLQFFRPPDANYEARELWALSNLVIGSTAPTAYVGCDACLVANNSFYLPQRWVTRILQETTEPGFIPCRDGRFINNIVVFDSTSLSTFVNVGPDTLPDSFSFSNNLWFSRDDPSFGGPTLPVTETDPIIQQDPLFVDPASEDFHLEAASPAIQAGVCLDELAHDRDRVCYQDPPTLGAYELP
jgi:hypothetical protein